MNLKARECTVLPLILSGLLFSCTTNPSLTIGESLTGHWLVETLTDKPIISGSQVELSFIDGEKLTGKASCNNFTTAYTIENDSLTTGHIATTRKLCAPDLMKQESTLLKALGLMHKVKINDGQLLMFNHEGVQQLKAIKKLST